ncbi:AMIN domain-containing protein, partial [bacterium]|nr:AMIN domain-containing protein [candidate division CSSED10-310 bacterium]
MGSKRVIPKINTLAIVMSFLMMVGGAVCFAADQETQASPTISRIEVRTAPSGEEVEIVGDQTFKHSAFVLTNPDRLVIDIPDATLAITNPEFDGSYKYIRSINTRTVAEGNKELVRIEFQLNEVVPYKVQALANGLSVTFGEVALGSVAEAADARSMTQSLPSHTETVADDQSAESQPGMSAAGSEASKVYGITPPTQYKGKPIFLDLKDADILDIFRLIAEVSGFNVVVDPDVSGRITIRMDNVPWDQALEVILKNQGLGKEIEGNVMRIARNEKLRDENILKQQLEYAKRHALPIETVILYLSYADINDMETSVKGLLSERGTIMKDQRVNAL